MPRPPLSSLHLAPEEARTAVELVMAQLTRFWESLDQQPPAGLAQEVVAGRASLGEGVDYAPTEAFPEQGRPLSEALDVLFEGFAPFNEHPGHPGYLAYVAGGGIFHAAIAQLIGMALNPYIGLYGMAPGFVRLESDVIRWLCTMVGYPSTAFGVLTSGGSMATLSAVLAARSTRLGNGPWDDVTIYVSDQVHHCVSKAANVCGLPPGALRWIATAPRTWRMDLEALERAIAQDRTEGRRPFLLVGSAGTTNTGAVDDLRSLGRIARENGMWFHVDGAYGAPFTLTEQGRALMQGIEEADSIVIDPHKSLCLPYGTGCVLVRDARTLRSGHGAPSSYMPPLQSAESVGVDFCELSPELSRDFRGLRLWLPLVVLGVEPFRKNLSEKLEMIQWVARELAGTAPLELLAEPQLTVVPFAMNLGPDMDQNNRTTRELLARVNARRNVFLSGCTLKGRFAIRVCLLSFRVQIDRVRQGLADVRDCAQQIAASARAGGLQSSGGA